MHYERKSVGNIMKDDWDEIWRKLSKWRSDDIQPSECRNCTAADECGYGYQEKLWIGMNHLEVLYLSEKEQFFSKNILMRYIA